MGDLSSSVFFSLTQAEYAAGNFRQKLLEGSILPTNIDRKFFIDIVKSNLNSEVLIFHPSKSFKYALSYLRWLKRSKTDLQKFIDSYHIHKEVLNKSYTRTKSNVIKVKKPFIKRSSNFQKTKDELVRHK